MWFKTSKLKGENKNLITENTRITKIIDEKDKSNKTKTTYSYSKALSTTVVRPVIVQEVTTRKPIIAPVDIRTPVNFFEGQPLNSEDLIIQNFFKNTSSLVDATEKDYSNSYLFQGNNFLAQSVQYPTYQTQPQQQYNNYNFLSQSVQLPSQRQNVGIAHNTIETDKFTRPLIEKVEQNAVRIEEFNPLSARGVQNKIVNEQIVLLKV